MATHSQMTAEEWVEEWVMSGGAEDPPQVIERGLVVASVKGGTYQVTVPALEAVLSKYYTQSGTKLRKAVIERSMGDDDNEATQVETVDFYGDATPFELAVILAWYEGSGK